MEVKEFSDGNIKPPAAFNKSLAPALNDITTKPQVRFVGSYLNQDSHIYWHINKWWIFILFML